MIIDPKNIPTHEFHAIMLGTIAPRPIAFASTIDKNGNVNLSPFSFFNAFSSNPPTLIFSAARRVRDNTIKHTLENIYEVDEVVINVVNYAMVEQTSLASTEYEKGINEFTKAGFTEEKSILVRPPRVKESPASFECKVKQIIELGKEGGAGNLIICEILLAHITDEVFEENKKQIDPQKIDLVARMGADWYCRTNGDAIFKIEKPLLKKGIGVDQIPFPIKNSKILTGNNLGKLGNVEALPSSQEIKNYKKEAFFAEILAKQSSIQDTTIIIEELHHLAKSLLDQNKVADAWKILIITMEIDGTSTYSDLNTR